MLGVTKMATTRVHQPPTEINNTLWICWVLLTFAAGTVLGECVVSVLPECRIDAQCSSTFDLVGNPGYYTKRKWLTYKEPCQRYQTYGYGYYTEEKHVNLVLDDMINSFEWPSDFFNLATIESLYASYNVWSYVPPGILSLSHIKNLNVSHCQIDMISLHDFVSLSELNSLDLSYNWINSVAESKTAISATHIKLSTLTLAHNNISEMGFALVPFVALTKLYLDHNKFKSIKRENFEKMVHLETLILSHCIIESIDFTVMYELPELKYLDLSNNLISSLGTVYASSTSQIAMNTLILSYNKIAGIGWALAAFVGLIELHLDHNNIKFIEGHNFENLQDLQYLYINDNLVGKLDSNVFHNLKSLATIDISNNEISGRIDPILFRNNVLLQEIDISNNKLSCLEKNSLQNLNLTYFNICENMLEGSLQKGMLNGLDNVDLLNMSYNKLSIIDNLAFVSITDLKTIELSHNSLSSIEIYAFSSLRSLETIDLSYNNLTKIDFDKSDLSKVSCLSLKCNNFFNFSKHSFQDLNALKFLDITCNHIKAFEINTFSALTKLTKLLIENNELQGEVVEKALSGLESLLHLNLSWTKMTVLRNNSFNELKSLQKLNLSNSHFTEIEYNTFSGPTSIVELDISQNYLTTFLIDSTHIHTLELLILNNNCIVRLQGATFIHLLNLKELLVAHNNLTNIEDNAFSHNADLQNIDLSKNTFLKSESKFIVGLPSLKLLSLIGVNHLNFKEITETVIEKIILTSSEINNISLLCLSNVKSLKMLDLNSNLVIILQKNAFNSLSELLTLDLSRNHIENIEPATFQDNMQLKYLNLSTNKISILTFGIFKGLNSIENIDLSNNIIKVLNAHHLFAIPTLKHLIIDDNSISDLNASDFVDSKIEEISIGGNTLSCSMLVKFMKKASSYSFRLTARTLTFHLENVDGITCVELPDNRDYTFAGNPTSVQINADFVSLLAQNINDIKSKVNDIIAHTNQNISFPDTTLNKDFLFNYSNIMSAYFVNQLESQANLSKILVDELKQETQILREINSNDKELRNESHNSEPNHIFDSNFTLMMSELFDKQFEMLKNISRVSINNTNVDLREFLTELKHEHTLNQGTSSTLLASKISDEERKTLIEAIKQQLIPLLNERAEYILSAAKINNNSLSSISTTNPDRNITSSSMFMEICLGLILLLMVSYIVYQLYTSKSQAAKARIESNQQFLNNLELHD